jgi:O-antigen/teichoic acid export membrane protein
MQVGYTAIMARLLNPSDFGLVAMGGVVLRFGSYFAQMGMSSAIIQKKDLTKGQISAAFTSSIILGFIFTLLTFVLSPLAQLVFNNQDVVPVVRLMGLSFFINGFSLTALALIRRELKFKSLAIAEIVSFLIGYLIIGIGSAFFGLGVWSLVFASLSQSLILAVLTFLIIRHEVSLTFSWVHYKPLISFGSKVSVISFLEFIGYSLDTILIGRFFGDKKLGYYNRAQMLVNLPMNYLITSFSRVLFPSFSIIQDENEKIKKYIFFILKVTGIIILPFAVVVSILSKEIVLVILGTKWMASINILRILAFAASFDFMLNSIAILFEAKGILKEKLYIQSSFILVLALAYYISFPFGLAAFALALTFAQLFRLISYSGYLIIKMKIKLREFLKVFISPLLSSIIIVCLLVPIKYLLNVLNINLFINLIVTAILALIIYVAMLFLKYNAEVKNVIMDVLLIILRRN